jgi:multiple antibiotic resistance protein
MDILTATITLVLIMDPLGNLPIFSAILKNIEPRRRKFILARELVISLLIMLLFLYSGQSILDFLHLRQETVSIAGGIILFLIALRMIFPDHGPIAGIPDGQEPFIVPLAIPMIAGPSLLAALILLANQHQARMLDWTIALGSAWLISAFILMLSNVFTKLLGERGLMAIERLMGMVLVMLSIQMFLDGVGNYWGITA